MTDHFVAELIAWIVTGLFVVAVAVIGIGIGKFLDGFFVADYRRRHPDDS